MTGQSGPAGGRRSPAIVLVPLVLITIALVATTVLVLPPGPTPSPEGSRPPTGAPTEGSAAVPAPPVAPLLVSLRVAGPAVVGMPLRISAAALGTAGIAALDMWVGGSQLELQRTSDPERPAATARWEWRPDAAGPQVLVARAYDALGRMAQSAPVRLEVTAEPPRTFRLEEVTARAGETLSDVVARSDGDLALARRFAPDHRSGPLPAGTLVAVPIFDEPPEAGVGHEPLLAGTGPLLAGPAAPQTPVVSAGRDGMDRDLALVADVGPIVPAGLVTPDLEVTVGPDCLVTATAGDGGSANLGFAFSALPPDGDTYLMLPPVAPAADGTASTSFAALAGTNFLTVSAYDKDASTASAILPFVVPDACTDGGWTGDARLIDGKLVTGASPDRAYLYLRVGAGGWQRIPAAAGTFVEPSAGVYDFGPLLPSLAGHDLELEAWGWTDDGLARLGQGSYVAPAEPLYQGGYTETVVESPLGFGTSLDNVYSPGGGEFAEQLTKSTTVERPGPKTPSVPKIFKWQTTAPGVTKLVWQVLPYPLDKTETNLAPPLLIDTDEIAVTGNTSGYFTLDLKPYLLPDAVTKAVSQDQFVQEVISGVQLGGPSGPSATKAPTEVIATAGQLWLSPSKGGASVGDVALADVGLLTPPINALYVRVIPMVGATPLPKASNVVAFDVVEPADPFYFGNTPPPQPKTYLDAYIRGTTIFFGPTGSNPAYARCVKVAKNGRALTGVEATVFGLYGGSNWKDGTVHCLPPPDDDGWSLADAFEAFVEWVGDSWDYVSGSYDWIQNQIVDVVLVFVPCEQIANEVSDNGKEVCKGIVKTGLRAVAAAYGIPPEIPTWEDTIALYKGDLREWILAQAKQEFPAVSIACDAASVAHTAKSDFPTCEKVIDKAIDESIKLIMDERSEAASKSSGVPVPPGIVVEPDPRSMAQPPHFEVTVTRTNAPLPPDAECKISGSMTSKVGGWTWHEYEWKGGHPKDVTKGPTTVSGEPFMSTSQTMAILEPGQSTTYEVWLAKPRVWFEPDGFSTWYAKQYAEWHGQTDHAWVLLQKGATVTGTLTSNCFPGGSATEVLKGQAWQ